MTNETEKKFWHCIGGVEVQELFRKEFPTEFTDEQLAKDVAKLMQLVGRFTLLALGASKPEGYSTYEAADIDIVTSAIHSLITDWQMEDVDIQDWEFGENIRSVGPSGGHLVVLDFESGTSVAIDCKQEELYGMCMDAQATAVVALCELSMRTAKSAEDSVKAAEERIAALTAENEALKKGGST